jgi:exodeoxyribonuclease-1
MYLAYDLETTGTDVRHDQILQFGALLADEDFYPIRSVNLRSRLMSHIVPSPKALEVTGVTTDMLDRGMEPYDFVSEMHETFTRFGPVTVMSYNGLSFDEEAVRSAFFQSLRPPYVTTSGGNKRADLYGIVQAFYVLRPDVLTVPRSEEGKPILKLDRLAPANGFEDMNAHDALGDVLATLHLARLMRDADPDLFAFLMSLGDPKVAASLIETGEPVRLYTHFGRPEVFDFIAIANHRNRPKNWAGVDLARDPNEVLSLGVGEIAAALRDPSSAFRQVRTNQQPVVFMAHDPNAPAASVTTDETVLAERARLYRGDAAFRERLAEALASLEFATNTTLESRIYDIGFPSRPDEALMKQFHAQHSWSKRYELAHQFESADLRAIAQRVVYTNAPEAIGNRDEFDRRIASARLLAEGEQPFTTLLSALASVDEVDDPTCREEIRNWLERRIAEARTLSTGSR